MKYKLTNVSGLHIQDSLPGVIRINLLPEESIIISDVVTKENDKEVTYTALDIVKKLKQARKPYEDSLEAKPVLEDKEVVKILEKVGEKASSGVNPAFAALVKKVEPKKTSTPSLFDALKKD